MKSRVKNENIKLLTQNIMASEFTLSFIDNARASGLGGNEAVEGDLLLCRSVASHLLTKMEYLDQLEPEDFNSHLQSNKDLRRIYDQIKLGQKQARKSLGGVDTMLPFDKAFTPPGGWKKYFDTFPLSADALLASYLDTSR